MSVAVVMTGGTIAKTYHPRIGELVNQEPKVASIISGLRLDGMQIDYVDLMHRDSLTMDDAARAEVVSAVRTACRGHDAVLVTHGTDTLAETARVLCAEFDSPPVPVVFTCAMVPFVVAGSDAAQNVTEALLSLRLLPPGAFLVLHNRILALPDVAKNFETLTFDEA